MNKPIEEQQFAGDTISVYRYQPDYLVKINGLDFGFYLSPAAGINAAQRHITETLEAAAR